MKECPSCKQVYADDTLNFCLSDGTTLSVVSAKEEPTVVIPSARPTQTQAPTKAGVSPFFAYLAIGLLAMLVGGGVVAWFTLSRSPEANTTTPVNGSNTQPAPKNTNTGGNSSVAQYPTESAAPLTSDSARNVLNSWVQAQNSRNFSTYQDCYDPSFTGVKTVKNGRSKTYNYSSWMADRRQMLSQAVNLNVQMSNLRIRMDGDTAIAEFDQYYRSLKYSDWGPKEIRIKMTPSGPKIIYEILKDSNPL